MLFGDCTMYFPTPSQRVRTSVTMVSPPIVTHVHDVININVHPEMRFISFGFSWSGFASLVHFRASCKWFGKFLSFMNGSVSFYCFFFISQSIYLFIYLFIVFYNSDNFVSSSEIHLLEGHTECCFF